MRLLFGKLFSRSPEPGVYLHKGRVHERDQVGHNFLLSVSLTVDFSAVVQRNFELRISGEGNFHGFTVREL